MIKNRTEEEIRQHYDSKETDNPIEAQDYVLDGKPLEYDVYKKEIIDPVLELLRLEPDHNVLDVGCGAGTILLEVEKLVNYAEGIDISQKLISMYKGPSLVRCGSVNDFEFENDKYNRIYMVSVSIHFPDLAYFKNVVHKLLKATAPGGILLISDQLIADFYESPKYFSLRLHDLIDIIKETNCHFELLTQHKDRRERNRYDIIIHKNL